jgi:hypothetical protein
VRLARRTNCAAPGKIRARTISCSLVRIDRKSLPLGTARLEAAHRQHSVAPTPAAAVACLQPPSPSPINTNTVGPDQAIICVNTEPRTNPAGNVINLTTNGTGRGISVEARFGDSPLSIVNCGDIAASGGGDNFGIFATARVNSPISIENSGDIASTTSVGRAYGMFAVGRSPISVANSGDIAVATSAANPGHSTASAVGIAAATYSGIAPVSVENSGDVHAASDHALAVAIIATTDADYGPVSVVNEGDLTAISGGLGSPAYAGTAFGILAFTGGMGSPLSIDNSGDIVATATEPYGISYGIQARTFAANSAVAITNSGDIDPVTGIDVRTYGDHSPIAVDNSGDIEATQVGILALSDGANSPVSIANSGDVTTTGASIYESAAIIGVASGADSSVVINNSGTAQGLGPFGVGVYARPIPSPP